MLARIRSVTLHGVEAIPLTVEVDISPGLPSIHTVGLPDAAIRESADRVRAALRNAGFKLPPRRITISLAPAEIRKQGAGLDLPIALAILAAHGALPAGRLDRLLVVGELALDGAVRRVRGGLPAALMARRDGLEAMILPADNSAEALAIPGPGVHPVRSLSEAIDILRRDRPPDRAVATPFAPAPAAEGSDLSEVCGQAHARRALEVAAAGGHHLLMVGPPGCGKTMLARRLPGILPPLDLEEAIEVTCVYSAAGLLETPGLVRSRPFRAPHHTLSGVGLVGGGRGPQPGEVTLAHRGVLFLDELAEFGRATLDVLRQPLEEGMVVIRRAASATRMPARFTLVAAMNPCPCGQLGRADRPCGCTPAVVALYRARVSGPLLDRFEMQLELSPVPLEALRKRDCGESSATVAARVAAARLRRNAGNADRAPEGRRHADRPDEAGSRLLALAMNRFALSARAHDAILRVARTIACLDGAERIAAGHVAEAIQYRALDRARTRDPC